MTNISIDGNGLIICSAAFNDCKGLKKVFIGRGVKTISKVAFYNCDVQSVIIPKSTDNLRWIPDSAFVTWYD